MIRQEVKGLFAPRAVLLAAATAVAPALIYGWLATRFDSLDVRLHLAYGAGVFAVWTGYLFRVSYLIFLEDMLGTLDAIRLSTSSLYIVGYSKCLGLLLGSLPRGVCATIVTLIMIGGDRGLTRPVLWISIFLILASLHAAALLLSPLRVYVAVREGALNSLIPATAILSAILFPASRMPDALYWISAIFPIRWAMETLSAGAAGETYTMPLMLSVGLIILYNILAAQLYGHVESKLASE